MLDVVVEFLGHLIFGPLLYGTGWSVLFILTLGRGGVLPLENGAQGLWRREYGVVWLTANAVMPVGALAWVTAIGALLWFLLRH